MSRFSLLFVLIAATMMATACRTTHEADSDELANLNEIATTIGLSSDVSTDQGDASVGSIFAVQSLFQGLADKDNTRAAGFAMSQLPSDNDYTRMRLREFGDCVDETDSRVDYNDCGWSGSGGGGSVSFLLAGFYAWTDSSSESDLIFDLDVDGGEFGAGTTLTWSGNSAWTSDTFDGNFDLFFGIDVELLGASIPGTGVDLSVKADFDALKWDEACDNGPVSGIIDWKSTWREGTDPQQNRHVTVEYLECASATITW